MTTYDLLKLCILTKQIAPPHFETTHSQLNEELRNHINSLGGLASAW